MSQLFCHSPRFVSVVPRFWIPQSFEAVSFRKSRYQQSLSSITFESDSRLKRIESKVFSFSSLQSTVIPRNVESLCSSCFFEVSIAFINHIWIRFTTEMSWIGCIFIIITSNNCDSMECVIYDRSAFVNMSIDFVLIERRNTIFEMMNRFVIDVQSQKLIRSFSSSSKKTNLRSFSILRLSCFAPCRSLSSITFESDSRLTRIESFAFSSSSLQSIVISRSVEVLCSSCFSLWQSLSSITFEFDSRLTRI
jgi:hypothetical protein